MEPKCHVLLSFKRLAPLLSAHLNNNTRLVEGRGCGRCVCVDTLPPFFLDLLSHQHLYLSAYEQMHQTKGEDGCVSLCVTEQIIV